MGLSPRGILAIGLSLAGVAYLVAPSLGQGQGQGLGQGQQQKADAGVRAATGNASASTAPAAPVPPLVGTVDLDIILKNYEKVKVLNKELAAAVSLRRGELVKIESDAREEMQMMQKFTPGTADYKKHEDRLTEMKVKLDAGQEQAQREFTLRQAEMFATLYKEIQAMVARVAKWHKMTYVLRVSSRPPSATEQNSVIAAMMETVIFSDPQNDITNDVVHYLNYYYKATASPAPAQRPATRQPSATEDPAAR